VVKLKYNAKAIDRSKDDLTPPKAGVWPMVVESCVHEKDNNRLVLVARMLENDSDGAGKGYGFWEYLSLSGNADWKIDQWVQALLGIDTESKDEVEFDPKNFVNKKFRGRVKADWYDKEDGNGPQYRPKLGKPFPFTKSEEDEEGYDETSELDGEAADVEGVGEVDMPSKDEVLELGESADGDDEEAIALLDTLGRQAGLDPNEYTTWGELAAAIAEAMVDEPEPEEEEDVDLEKMGAAADGGSDDAAAKLVELGTPNGLDDSEYGTWADYATAIAEVLQPKKPAAAKKGAAKKAAAKPAAKEEPADDEAPNYDDYELDDLKAEARSRGISDKGPMSAIKARLLQADADPFA
jgi:hypothetical protein